MQVEQVARKLQKMELATSPTTTGDETMVAQAEMLDQGTYVCIILSVMLMYNSLSFNRSSSKL